MDAPIIWWKKRTSLLETAARYNIYMPFDCAILLFKKIGVAVSVICVVVPVINVLFLYYCLKKFNGSISRGL
ncbi:Suppressor of lethality of KEX2 GAS1 double null mutant protein [Trichinella spiralis]|uniref:Suppressor of lethality of KEX2 GAS1 double null mutant protein n=1 Tax=Trichinella spiralis TaxID=6334 RepID=A0ABR3KCD8_TRISP